MAQSNPSHAKPRHLGAAFEVNLATLCSRAISQPPPPTVQFAICSLSFPSLSRLGSALSPHRIGRVGWPSPHFALCGHRASVFISRSRLESRFRLREDRALSKSDKAQMMGRSGLTSGPRSASRHCRLHGCAHRPGLAPGRSANAPLGRVTRDASVALARLEAAAMMDSRV